MNAIDMVADVSRVGMALIFNSLWQGALIAGVAWLTLRVFSRANATTRYAVWSLTLLAMLIVPAVTSLSRVSFTPQVAVTTTIPVTHAAATSRTASHVVVPTHSQTAAPMPMPWYASRVFTVNVPLIASAIVFGAWILGALFILVRLIVGLMQLERLKSDSLPLDIAYRDTMPRWSAALKGERDVRICVSEHVEVPVAVGLFDSMILLPAHLVQTLDAAEIDQISLHELGHLLRGDDWTNAMQRLAGALMFFSPAAWFVSRQMDVEREVACDDYVLESTGAVRPYAFCLTKMAEMTVWPHNPVPAPGVFVTRKNISIRIERLLRTGRAIGSSIAPNIAGVVTVALIAVFLLLRTMTPGIAFTVPAEPAVAAVPAAPAHPAKVAKVADKPAKPEIVALAASVPVVPLTPEKSADIAAKTAAAAARTASLAAKNAALAAPALTATAPVARPTLSAMVATNGSCTGCDFANADLSGRDFSGRSLEGTDFNGANLRNAKFDRANLTGSNFDGADLRGASFVDAHLSGCNLRSTRVEGARFDGADLTGCSIDISTFSPDQARVFLTRCRGCDFSHANLRGQDLHDIKISGADLRGADLRNANLSGAQFTGIDFSGAQLTGANVNGASFIGCDFRGVDLRGVDLSKANITGSSMSGATWQ